MIFFGLKFLAELKTQLETPVKILDPICNCNIIMLFCCPTMIAML